MVGELTAGGNGYSGGYFQPESAAAPRIQSSAFFAASLRWALRLLPLAPGYSGSVQVSCSARLWVFRMRTSPTPQSWAPLILLVRAVPPADCDGQPGPRECPRAMGLPVLALDIVLYVLVTHFRGAGPYRPSVMLVLALLVIPASAAPGVPPTGVDDDVLAGVRRYLFDCWPVPVLGV